MFILALEMVLEMENMDHKTIITAIELFNEAGVKPTEQQIVEVLKRFGFSEDEQKIGNLLQHALGEGVRRDDDGGHEFP